MSIPKGNGYQGITQFSNSPEQLIAALFCQIATHCYNSKILLSSYSECRIRAICFLRHGSKLNNYVLTLFNPASAEIKRQKTGIIPGDMKGYPWTRYLHLYCSYYSGGLFTDGCCRNLEQEAEALLPAASGPDAPTLTPGRVRHQTRPQPRNLLKKTDRARQKVSRYGPECFPSGSARPPLSLLIQQMPFQQMRVVSA